MDITGIGSVADLATSVIGKIWPDKTQQEREQLAAAVTLVQGQLAVNQAEAASPSIFVAGWRPFVGWICGSGLAWNFIARPALEAGMTVAGHPIALPAADLGELMPLLFGLLGLGTLRTVEKIKGVA